MGEIISHNELNDLCAKLNKVQEFGSFEFIAQKNHLPLPIHKDDLHGFTNQQLFDVLKKQENFPYKIGITHLPLEGDCFNVQDINNGIAIITLNDIEKYNPNEKNKIQYLSYLTICAALCLVCEVDFEDQHKENYCLFDFCIEKSTLTKCLEKSYICDECLDKIATILQKGNYKTDIELILKYVRHQMINKTIFLSYCSKETDLADAVDNAFSNIDGLQVTRYTRDVEYRDSFKEFMKRVKEHDYVIMLISDSFLKSQACMFEVSEILTDLEFKKKLMPIVISDCDANYLTVTPHNPIGAKVYDQLERDRYIVFWEQQYKHAKAIYDEIESDVAKIESAKNLREIRRIIDNDLGVFLSYVSEHLEVSFSDSYGNGFFAIRKAMDVHEEVAFPLMLHEIAHLDFSEITRSAHEQKPSMTVSSLAEKVKAVLVEYRRFPSKKREAITLLEPYFSNASEYKNVLIIDNGFRISFIKALGKHNMMTLKKLLIEIDKVYYSEIKFETDESGEKAHEKALENMTLPVSTILSNLSQIRAENDQLAYIKRLGYRVPKNIFNNEAFASYFLHFLDVKVPEQIIWDAICCMPSKTDIDKYIRELIVTKANIIRNFDTLCSNATSASDNSILIHCIRLLRNLDRFEYTFATPIFNLLKITIDQELKSACMNYCEFIRLEYGLKSDTYQEIIDYTLSELKEIHDNLTKSDLVNLLMSKCTYESDLPIIHQVFFENDKEVKEYIIDGFFSYCDVEMFIYDPKMQKLFMDIFDEVISWNDDYSTSSMLLYCLFTRTDDIFTVDEIYEKLDSVNEDSFYMFMQRLHYEEFNPNFQENYELNNDEKERIKKIIKSRNHPRSRKLLEWF